jgi:hypothetical protein
MHWMSLGQYETFSDETRREIIDHVRKYSDNQHTIEKEQVTVATME